MRGKRTCDTHLNELTPNPPQIMGIKRQRSKRMQESRNRSRWEKADWCNYFNEESKRKYTEMTDMPRSRRDRQRRRRESMSWKVELINCDGSGRKRAGEGIHEYKYLVLYGGMVR